MCYRGPQSEPRRKNIPSKSLQIRLVLETFRTINMVGKKSERKKPKVEKIASSKSDGRPHRIFQELLVA